MVLIDNFILLFVESAPFLLIGMFMAGCINQLVPKAWVNKVLGKKSSVVTAAFIGAPLPLCSCSVIPVAMGIRRSGASKASTASFLVATPETGIDSIGVTYALMGPVMTVIRPVAAIFSAIVTGVMIAIWGREQAPEDETISNTPSHTCCSKKTVTSSPVGTKLLAAVTFGFGQLLRDFMLWFLVGIFFAALISTYVPQDFMTQYAQGIGAMLVAVVISIPMYICATASTPVAVGLLMSGVSPGAALVFMLTGPATNIATLMVIKKELGTRELVVYLVGLIVSAVATGMLVDYLFATYDWKLNLAHGDHSGMLGLVYQLSALILASLIAWQIYQGYFQSLHKKGKT